MPSVVTMTTFRLGLVFFRLITLGILLQFSKAESGTNPSPVISSSVATHICNQQTQFQDSGAIQTPVKTRPENDDSKCGWLLWTKCVEGNSESCPSFDLQPCDESEPGNPKKKGKGIPTSGKQKQEKARPPDPCENSTEIGLPDPKIVSSMSKYPSVVTIEVGDGCRTKSSTGLILNENWVIVHQTGGFWLYQPEHPDFYEIVAGQRKTYVEEGTEQRRSVAEYIPHPGAKIEQRKYYKDNIGLVRVSTPFQFNENVQPIDLSAIEALAPSIPTSKLTIVGWLKGRPMKEEEELLASLIESPLDFVPMDECYDRYMEDDEAPRETLLCAGKCVVQGDKNNQPMKSILYAQQSEDSPLVPVGLGPIRRGAKQTYSIPGIFVNLASYIPWIKETTEGQGQGQGQGQSETTAIPESDSDSRIIRGDDAPPYKYKSMVNLEEYRSYACTKHKCGGSILNEEWILTAGHCVVDADPKDIRLMVGDHDISVNDENEQILSVSKIIVHENFNSTNALNDIAVLKVSPPIKFNDKVEKARLPEPSYEVTGPLMAVGWGTDENYVSPHILQELDITFFPLEECQELYAGTDKVPTESMMCAGNATHSTCKGLGEPCKPWPKIKIDPDGRSTVGVLANGTDVFRPGVFTRVAYYIDWIMKNAELA